VAAHLLTANLVVPKRLILCHSVIQTYC